MGAVENIKEILALVRKIDNQELLGKITDLRQDILDLKEENRILKDKLRVRENILYEKPYYFLIEQDKKDGPFCQVCYDSEGKLIRLQNPETGSWYCNVCKNAFFDNDYKPGKGVWTPDHLRPT